MKLLQEKVAILDAGAQYGKVIDRRVRELKIFSEILPINTDFERLRKYKAIIISGGPQSVYDKKAPKCDVRVFNQTKIPVLGICYGMQLMNYERGGSVVKGTRREDGPSTISITNSSRLFKSLHKKEEVLMSHGDSVIKLPNGFIATAKSGQIIAAIENKKLGLYGVQFHPEVDLTINGKIILQNFLYGIAGFIGIFSIENRELEAIRYIRKHVGKKHVLVLASGGVDSTVCAALLRKALHKKQISILHIDSGFMRKEESRKVKAALEKIGLSVQVIDASYEFYSRLNSSLDPETKRVVIGDIFIKVAEKAIRDLGIPASNLILAQGTLRPDLIESASHLASSKADKIKTHHNDAPTVRELRKKGRIIEPLRDYHKDEVRELGQLLGLPSNFLWRQPFPGPGLAIRILCANKPYITQNFKTIEKKLKRFQTGHIQTTLLPIRSVGVQGDGRTYSYVAGLSGKISWSRLFKLAREIPKEIHQINRVVYIFGQKLDQISPISITPTFLTPDVIKQLQEADDIVNQTLQKFKLIKKLSQVPVILTPLDFNQSDSRSIVIRTFITNDFMTGIPAVPGSECMPKKVLNEMVKRILKEVPGISRVLYDLTCKPPGTTEWE